MSENKIIFGSMRMDQSPNSISTWVNLFKLMWDEGIRLHHVSSEYQSYSLYLEVLEDFRRNYPGCQLEFIVKFAEPHFGHNNFNTELFNQGIEKYRNSLKVDQIHSVQWMWRGDLGNEDERLLGFENNKSLISHAVNSIKATNKIKYFHVFPYSLAFAELAISCEFVDGLIVYRNLLETEYDSLILKQNELGKFGYILRPLAAGKLDFSVNSSYNYLMSALELPSIQGGIISISSKNRLSDLLV
jgi:hypothetical protein